MILKIFVDKNQRKYGKQHQYVNIWLVEINAGA